MQQGKGTQSFLIFELGANRGNLNFRLRVKIKKKKRRLKQNNNIKNIKN
jgi:hypothetical protein